MSIEWPKKLLRKRSNPLLLGISDATQSGLLYYKTHTRWQKRYCILSSNFLSFYGSRDTKTHKKTVHLTRMSNIKSSDLQLKDKYCFTLEIVQKRNTTPVIMAVNTSFERQEWIDAIAAEIKNS